MGMNFRIFRKDGEPLGDFATIQQALTDAFPGIQFAIEQEEPEVVRKMRESGALAAYRASLPQWIKVEEEEETHYPRCEATYQGEGFAVQFYIAITDLISSFKGTLYGRGGDEFDRHMAALDAATGWDGE